MHSEDDNTDSGKLLPKGSPMLWTYVPMDKDEVIIELWYLWSSHGVINLVVGQELTIDSLPPALFSFQY